MSRLIMRRGPQPGKVFELTTDIVTIGGGSKNSVVIMDNDVSRDHCKLIRVMADYEVQDLNSVRGTFVSGQRVRDGWVLKPGDLIELGENVMLEYERASINVELQKVDLPAPTRHSEKPSPDAAPSLVMKVGPKPGNIYPLTDRKVTIGRDLTNDIVIQDPEISRFHLVLKWADTSYQIQELGSTNGTMVNGNVLPPATPTPLHANDAVQIATSIELIYTWQPDDIKIEAPKAVTPPPKRPSPKQTTKLTTSEQPVADSKPFGITTKRQTSRLGTGLQPGSLVDHVFITYARPEWESIVALMAVTMQDAGMDVWVDQYLIQGGDDWMVAVEQALSECWLLVVVVSPEALESRYVRLAYRYFFNREKPIIPLLYANVESLPLELRNSKAIRYNPQNPDATFKELMAEIRNRTP
ncbi:MAG: FHA domain-containing protein [Anaerolineae bacterium]|nr:FHA domain-containing protein [Anaerolineae bacterium]